MSDVAAPPPAPNRKVPTERVVLLAILGVLLVALGFDLRARLRANSVYGTIDGLLKEEDEGPQKPFDGTGPRTPKAIAQLAGQLPDAELVQIGAELHETYSWRGVINTYYVYVIYREVAESLDGTRMAEPLLQRVLKNRRPENAPSI